MKRAVAVVYLVAGIVSALICLRSLLWAIWGAPTSWTQYVGLFSSLALVGCAIRQIGTPTRRQDLCAICTLGLAFFYVPAAVSLAPAESQIISPFSYVIIVGYLLLLGAVLFYPYRLKSAGLLFGLVVLAMFALTSMAVGTRWTNGEYDRPATLCFIGHRSQQPLVIDSRFDQVFSPTLRKGIQDEGLGGELRWCGSQNWETKPSKMVVIALSQIKVPAQLHYPKHGTVVYVWDGGTWTSIPSNVVCYKSFSTLRPDGMISVEEASGGISSFRVFPWN
jgi:hypothetical protein